MTKKKGRKKKEPVKRKRGPRKAYLIKIRVDLEKSMTLDDFRSTAHGHLETMVDGLERKRDVKRVQITRIQAKPIRQKKDD